jgi:LDH2 family malate/lactate/ureidoglycolate dehydrogenase
LLLLVDVMLAALDGRRFVTTVREGDFVAATPERHCGLYVIVDRPRLVSDLQEFLRELGFIAAHPRGEGLDVSIPGSPDTAQARRVVNVYLAIWQAVHPGVRASIVERDGVSKVGGAIRAPGGRCA